MTDIEQAKAEWEDIRADPDTAIRREKWAVWANTTGLALINEVAALRHDITRQMDIANEHVNEAASLRKQLEDAREALRQWWCIGCNGTGQIGVMVNGEYRSEKHHHCDGVGLEPIAHQILKGKS